MRHVTKLNAATFSNPGFLIRLHIGYIDKLGPGRYKW